MEFISDSRYITFTVRSEDLGAITDVMNVLQNNYPPVCTEMRQRTVEGSSYELMLKTERGRKAEYVSGILQERGLMPPNILEFRKMHMS
jgi:hypothetical protein